MRVIAKREARVGNTEIVKGENDVSLVVAHQLEAAGVIDPIAKPASKAQKVEPKVKEVKKKRFGRKK